MDTPGQRKGGDHFNVMESAVGLAMDGLGDIGGSTFKIVYDLTYISVQGKRPWALKHNYSTFGPHGHLYPRIKTPYTIEAATVAP